MQEYQTWYQRVVDEPALMQGDLIYDCPNVIPPKEISIGAEIPVEITLSDVIILTQSCDLEKDDLEFVLVCPFWRLTELEEKIPEFKSKTVKESLKRGYQPAFIILDKLDGDESFLIANFKDTYSVPIEILKELTKKSPIRWRLNSPYREHLAQEFAKLFMRVGLPKGIPKFSSFDIDYCRKCQVNHSLRE